MFFFHKRENKALNTFLKVHHHIPPTPSLQWCKVHTHSVLVLKDWNSTLFGDGQRRGGGGGDFWTIVSIFFCLLEKKSNFYHKKSQHAKFQWIPSNLKNHKWNRYICAFLPWSPSSGCSLYPFGSKNCSWRWSGVSHVNVIVHETFIALSHNVNITSHLIYITIATVYSTSHVYIYHVL